MPLALARTAGGGETRTELKRRKRHKARRSGRTFVFIGWKSIYAARREHKRKSDETKDFSVDFKAFPFWNQDFPGCPLHNYNKTIAQKNPGPFLAPDRFTRFQPL